MRVFKNVILLFFVIAICAISLKNQPPAIYVPECSTVSFSGLRLGQRQASVDRLWGRPRSDSTQTGRHYLEFGDERRVVLAGSPEEIVEIVGPEAEIEGFRIRESDHLRVVEKIIVEMNLKVHREQYEPLTIFLQGGGLVSNAQKVSRSPLEK